MSLASCMRRISGLARSSRSLSLRPLSQLSRSFVRAASSRAFEPFSFDSAKSSGGSWSLHEMSAPPPTAANAPAPSASVTRADLQHLANLSYLPYPADDATLVRDVTAVVAWLDRITAVPVEQHEPMFTPLELPAYYQAIPSAPAETPSSSNHGARSLRMRADESCDASSAAAVLANAPFADRGFFVVPKVVDDEQ